MAMLTALVVIGAVVFALAPLWRGSRGDAAPSLEELELRSPGSRLRSRKEILLDSIRDLDFEFQTGKLEESDYRAAREGLLAETAGVMRDLDELSEHDDLDRQIEAAVARRKGAPGTPAVVGLELPSTAKGTPAAGPTTQPVPPRCAACGQELRPGASFCSACGKPVVATANCSNCEAELVAGDRFCGSCGATVKSNVG